MPKVLGFGLFLTATLVGFTSATNPIESKEYLVYSRPLAAGMKLSAIDFRSILLPDSPQLQRYFVSTEQAIGKELTRSVSTGELVSSDSWVTIQSNLQELTLSFDSDLLPSELARGQRLDLWIVPQDSAGNVLGSARLIAANLVIANLVNSDSNLSSSTPITFFTPAGQVAQILDAISSGQAFVVRR